MSIPVAKGDLGQHVGERRAGFVLSTSADGRPHASHQPMTWDEAAQAIEMPCGKSTAANVIERPLVCLLLPATDESDDGYSLIIDGNAQPATPDGRLVVNVTNCVLHRPAPEN